MTRWTMTAGAVLAAGSAQAAEINLEKSHVLVSNNEFEVPAQVLVEEVSRRAGVAWTVTLLQNTNGRTIGRVGEPVTIRFDIATADDQLSNDGFKIVTVEE